MLQRRGFVLIAGTPSHRPARDRGEGGASAVELAIIAPAFILLIFFTIQGSFFFYGRNVAIQSAREGVSQLRLASNAQDVTSASTATERFAQQIGRESLLSPKAEGDYDLDDNRVSMKVTGRVITLVPLLDLKVSATSEGSIENFQNLDQD